MTENICWDDCRVLLALQRAGSLLGAGKLLGLSTSTVGRRIDALESAIGTALVHRTQSGTTLTHHAQQLTALAESFEHGVRTVERSRGEAVQTVRISVPTGMAAPLAVPLAAMLREHGHIDVELIGENQMVDVAKREADLAVRLVRSESQVLVERHLTDLRFGLFASPDYVARHLPRRELSHSRATLQTFVGLDQRWKDLPHERWLTSLGAERFVFRSSVYEAIKEAVQRGLGLAALLDMGESNADLVRIQTETPGPTQPLYLVYHRDLRSAPHIRACVTAISNAVKAGGSRHHL